MDVFDGLADPVRRAILTRLVSGPVRVVDLAAGHGISRPAVSRHLRVLAGLALVTGQARGRERYYRLDPSPLAPVRDLLDLLDRTTATGAARPIVPEAALDALATEVRRTTRDRRRAATTVSAPTSHEETA